MSQSASRTVSFNSAEEISAEPAGAKLITDSSSPNIHSQRDTEPKYRVALAGNPNAGKTTLFNRLTGLRYKVANYPGVTVEKREGTVVLPEIGSATLIDLPGIYSLFGQSLDEIIATDCLHGEIEGEAVPDLVIAVVDASNLERNLYLTSQLIDLGRPVFVVLNMIDIAEKRGIRVRSELLSRALGAPVLSMVANRGDGVEQLKVELAAQLGATKRELKRYLWSPSGSPFFAAAEELGKAQVEALNGKIKTTDYVSIGAGLLSGACRAADPVVDQLTKSHWTALQAAGLDPSGFEAENRYRWIEKVIAQCATRVATGKRDWTESIDRVLTHRVWGTFSFLLLMAIIFQSIFAWAAIPMEFIDSVVVALGTSLGEMLPDGQLKSLLVDGIITGVGSVLIFIPQIAILYLFIGLLEDSGYLSRAAFLMDKIMRKFGLQGRSFIPLLSSFACAIPGIMSARVIPSFADRMATIMIAPLMSCSARLPVYALLIAAFVPPLKVFGIFSLQGLTLLSMYLLGIVAAAFVSLALKSTIFKGQPSHLVMEMPPYHLPSITLIMRNVWDRIVLFVKDAGTVILACSVVLWFLASYPRTPTGEAPHVRESYAGDLGSALEPVIRPLGFDWRIGVSLVASFAAREVFVGSMATVNNLENVDERSESLIEALRHTTNTRTGERYTLAVALSLMVFYCFACQCMSTLAVCRRETGSWRWPTFMFVYMTLLAYGASLVTYQIASRML